MAAEVKFENNVVKVKNAMHNKAVAVLEECASELESQTKRNTRVDTSFTKNDWHHTVTEHGDEIAGIVGSNNQNAIWEEFGTGEHALANNGRQGGWFYKDRKGKWHHTFGKKPSRALHKAWASLKNKIIKRIQDSFKGL